MNGDAQMATTILFAACDREASEALVEWGVARVLAEAVGGEIVQVQRTDDPGRACLLRVKGEVIAVGLFPQGTTVVVTVMAGTGDERIERDERGVAPFDIPAAVAGLVADVLALRSEMVAA